MEKGALIGVVKSQGQPRLGPELPRFRCFILVIVACPYCMWQIVTSPEVCDLQNNELGYVDIFGGSKARQFGCKTAPKQHVHVPCSTHSQRSYLHSLEREIVHDLSQKNHIKWGDIKDPKTPARVVSGRQVTLPDSPSSECQPPDKAIPSAAPTWLGPMDRSGAELKGGEWQMAHILFCKLLESLETADAKWSTTKC